MWQSCLKKIMSKCDLSIMCGQLAIKPMILTHANADYVATLYHCHCHCLCPIVVILIH